MVIIEGSERRFFCNNEMRLDQKKILVIGGAGLIGSHTVDRLLETNVREVVVYDDFSRGSYSNLGAALKDKRVKVYPAAGDITRRDALQDAISGADGVLHFAALWLLQCHEFPESAFKVNVEGTFNVIEACRREGVERLIYSSSASVYGDAISEPMEEDHPFNNKNFYGATKICGEALLRAYHHRYGLNYVGLRYMNVYGPRQDYQGAYIAVIMRMLDAIENGEGPTVLGNGSEAFDFVSVKDCAVANICALKAETQDEFYNVGTGVKTTLRTLAETLLDLTGSKLPVKYKGRSSSSMVTNRVGSTSKAKKEIGFEASVSLREGLRDLIEWRKIHKQMDKR